MNSWMLIGPIRKFNKGKTTKYEIAGDAKIIIHIFLLTEPEGVLPKKYEIRIIRTPNIPMTIDNS
ncbi:hypothetical protein J7L49_02480 [Candidatus Bathyarchaeota archaeon]|nr:hypothetical protein [Candidatus Bathyarchaeota archaeon]